MLGKFIPEKVKFATPSEMNKRIDDLDKRTTAIETWGSNSVNPKFVRIDKQIEELDKRTTAIETWESNSVNPKFVRMDKQIEELDKRTTAIEAWESNSVNPKLTRIDKQIDELDKRTTTLETWESNTVNPKLTKMDKWLGDVAEPALNNHEDRIIGLESRTSRISEVNNALNSRMNDIEASIPEEVTKHTEEFMKDNFKVYADSWWNDTSIEPKANDWYENKVDIGPKVAKCLEIPEGMKNSDIGELLGIFNRIGGRITPPPKLEMVAAPLFGGKTAGITPTLKAEITGITPGIPKMKTIAKAEELEDRLSKLTQTFWGTITGVHASWNSYILPTITDVSANKTRWNNVAEFHASYGPELIRIINGTSSVLDSRYSAMISKRFSEFEVTIQQAISNLGLKQDQLTFLADMTTYDSAIGGTPASKATSTIRFVQSQFGRYANFDAVLDGYKNKITGFCGDWWNLDSVKSNLVDRMNTWISDTSVKGTIKDYAQEWWDDWSKYNFSRSVLGFLETRSEWNTLRSNESELSRIKKMRSALSDIKIGAGTLKDNISSIRSVISRTRLDVATYASRIDNDRTGMNGIIRKHGWKALFGLPGVVWAGISIFEEFASHLNSFIENVGDVFSYLSSHLRNLETQISNLESSIESIRSSLETDLAK